MQRTFHCTDVRRRRADYGRHHVASSCRDAGRMGATGTQPDQRMAHMGAIRKAVQPAAASEPPDRNERRRRRIAEAGAALATRALADGEDDPEGFAKRAAAHARLLLREGEDEIEPEDVYLY